MPYFRPAPAPPPVRFASAEARAAFDKVREATFGLEDEDCKTEKKQLDLTGDRALDVVELVYRHLHWVNAPRASRRGR